jgi:hypothetical protein
MSTSSYPKDPNSLGIRATAKLHLGDFQGALDDSTAALHMYPRDPNSLGIRADAKLHLGDCQGALDDSATACTPLLYYRPGSPCSPLCFGKVNAS